MLFGRFRKPYRALVLAAIAVGLLSTGCGQQYVVLHPVGPVGEKELHLMELAAIAMAIVIVIVFALYFYAIIRFRDKPGNTAPYRPNWHTNKWLEVLWWVLPAVLLTIIAIPTVQVTFDLAHVPKSKDPVVIDVTSLTWKWLFEYPGQHIATVNYLEIPTGVPVLFELTADSPMNTLWIPQLGGMEYTMPNRVLPLWLQADKAGVYRGSSAQYSGVGFEKMFFNVKAVPMKTFDAWAAKVHATSSPMTMVVYHQLLQHDTMGPALYSRYPRDTFPTIASGFTLTGSGMYMTMHGQKGRIVYMPMSQSN
jgi:heme/copper-type cytochrome/quinol oxidase subunit 2